MPRGRHEPNGSGRPISDSGGRYTLAVTGELAPVGEEEEEEGDRDAHLQMIQSSAHAAEAEGGGGGGERRNAALLPFVNCAPPVCTAAEGGLQSYVSPDCSMLYTNPKAHLLEAPLQGPVPPSKASILHPYQNHLTGQLDVCHLNPYHFDKQYYMYHSTGIAEDPSDVSVDEKKRSQNKMARAVLERKRAREEELEAEEEEQMGGTTTRQVAASERSSGKTTTLAALEEELISGRAGIMKAIATGEVGGQTVAGTVAKSRTAPEEDTSAQNTDGGGSQKEGTKESVAEGGEEVRPKSKSVFHGKALKDYQGRSWLEPSRDAKLQEKTNYLPKKLVHAYVGHTMGVQAIRYIPPYGHMLLSAGMDSQIKIWDSLNQRKCMRTYSGHTKAVRDIQFTTDGSKFYSASYDENIVLWDTETGQEIGRYSNGKTPFCVTIHPDKSQQNVFIAGCSNKKAVQFDANSGKIVQEYTEHLGPVNTVTFVDDNRKIVTTSDDKKIFLWDFGIPVVVKHIAEPSMHSMPSAAVHPSNKFIAFQSMDNKIVVYESIGRFRYQARKRFRGHVCAGYAIHPAFSPDGEFISSGDVSGKLWFWDWKTMKNRRTLKCHDAVCIDVAWHPTMTSRVATCGWDGLVKLWD